MPRLKIILRYNTFYIFLLILTLFTTFLRITFFPIKSIINPSNTLEGVIVNYSVINDKYKIVIYNKEKVICYYKTKENLNLSIGDIIKVNGNIYEPSNNTIPNSFNYKKYLNNHGIFYLFNAKKIVKVGKNNNINYALKNAIINKANEYGKAKGYLKAFIIGDKTDLLDYNLYQKNGVSHLFALSGMHINLLISVIYLIFKKCPYKNIITIILLLFYLSITNYSASLIRSILFFILIIINDKYDLNISKLDLLILTATIFLLINPYIIYDYGFIYSVTVTAGIIMSSKYLKKNYVYDLIVISVSAFLFSIPITISLSNEINLLSILSNVIIVPFISLIIYPLSILTIIFSFLEPIFSLLLFILEWINYLISRISLIVFIPKFNIFIYIIYYVLLLLTIRSNNLKYIGLIVLLLLGVKLSLLFDKTYKVYFLDVGQGDSSLILHKNKSILIDTGGNTNYNISNNYIKLLKSMGFSSISFLIITHGDADHVGEAINLVNNFKVEKVVFNCGTYNDLEKELIKVLEKKKIKYYSCIKELNIDKNRIYFLQTKEYDNENDNSNVVYTELDGYKFMFMGDATVTTEKEILDKYNLPDIDVLKVGHHGSKTSSSKEFVDEISPKYSIISAGKNNHYGHPNKEVLENLENTKIYRTDKDGSIMFKIKNNKLKIETCSP